MKYKAVFLDFYGTLVFEDDMIIAKVAQKISNNSLSQSPPKVISSYWWKEFQQLFENSYGADFKTQRELETESIKKTLKYFECGNMDFNIDEELFDYWIKPDIFDDTLAFLNQNSVPVCVVSNIDRNDICRAILYHNMPIENVVTSEDAKSYKPRKEIFLMALEKMKLTPSQVLHVGDSLISDVKGANNISIDSFWLNRKGRDIPFDCSAAFVGNKLTDVLKILES